MGEKMVAVGEIVRKVIEAFADVVNSIVEECYVYGCEADWWKDEMWEKIYTAADTASAIIEKLTGMKVYISLEDKNCFEDGTCHDVYLVLLGEERNYIVAEFLIRRGSNWASLSTVKVYVGEDDDYNDEEKAVEMIREIFGAENP